MTPPLTPLDVIVPGDLATRTGGYVYDRRLVEALRAGGRTVVVHELDGAWPWPDEATRARAAALLAALPDGRRVLVDGLAFGALPDVVGSQAGRLALIALVHHPLAFEDEPDALDSANGGFRDEGNARLHDAERRALADAAHVVTTSPATTATLLAHYGVPPGRVTTVPPGTDPAPAASGSAGGTRNLLCVATLSPRKGHDVLLDALARLVDRDWQLRCAGSLTRDRPTADALRERVRRLGLADRVTFDGELDDAALAPRWHETDLFVLASRYEGYGMVFDEALARALPIVASGAGAVRDTVPDDAGLVVPPDDVDALAGALARWFDEPGLRDALRAGARRAAAARRDWRDVADEVARVIDALPTSAPEPTEPDGFDDAWLALREGPDHRSRDARLEERVRSVLRVDSAEGIDILDLGAGTGSNLRHLAPRLGHRQRWTLVDHDDALLGRLETRLAPWAARHGARVTNDAGALVVEAATFGARVHRRRADLASELDTLPFAEADLVTGSALLDLAGAGWLGALVRLVGAHRSAVLFALSYDGRLRWTPGLDDDAAVHERFDRHQRTDKGLGAALGPDAAAHFAERLRAAGFDVADAPSDWRLDGADAELQDELAAGFARAAAEIDPDFGARAERWLAERGARLRAGKSGLTVGHVDVFAHRPRPSWLDAEGRVTRWPKRAADKRACLEHLAGGFAPGTSYDEGAVNAIIRARTVDGDHALLRRELCVAGLLIRRRDGSRYRLAD